MGDIADWLLASQDPFGLDHFDDDGEGDIPFNASRSTPHCRNCGSTDVRWRQQGGKWVLFSLEPGKVHLCDTSDDFGVVK